VLFRSWFSISSHELVRTFFGSDATLFDLMKYDLVIIYHGFDSLPNKLTADHVNQVASSRGMRGLPTLILEKVEDHDILYPITPVNLKAQARARTAAKQASTRPDQIL
jgi:hypothetical protein